MQQTPPLFSFGSEEVESGDLVTWLKLPSDSILNVNNRRLNGLYYAPRWCTSKHWLWVVILWVIAQNHMHQLDWEESTKKAHKCVYGIDWEIILRITPFILISTRLELTKNKLFLIIFLWLVIYIDCIRPKNWTKSWAPSINRAHMYPFSEFNVQFHNWWKKVFRHFYIEMGRRLFTW
jgi:hypothetical protein